MVAMVATAVVVVAREAALVAMDKAVEVAVKASTVRSPTSVTKSDHETGWVAGVGGEAKLSHAASIGLEALFYGFDDEEER